TTIRPMNKKLILLLTGALLVGGGTAAAQVLPAAGVIHACSGANGALRMTDPTPQSGRVCNNGETYVTWNQTGPKGATGAAGPMGAPGATGRRGPQGPAGPSFVRAAWALEPATERMVEIELPPNGYYVIDASAYARRWVDLDEPTLASTRCMLWVHRNGAAD